MVAHQAVAHQLLRRCALAGWACAMLPSQTITPHERTSPAGLRASRRRCRCIPGTGRSRRARCRSGSKSCACSGMVAAAERWTSLARKVPGSSRPSIVTGQPRATAASTAVKPIGPMPVTRTRGGSPTVQAPRPTAPAERERLVHAFLRHRQRLGQHRQVGDLGRHAKQVFRPVEPQRLAEAVLVIDAPLGERAERQQIDAAATGPAKPGGPPARPGRPGESRSRRCRWLRSGPGIHAPGSAGLRPPASRGRPSAGCRDRCRKRPAPASGRALRPPPAGGAGKRQSTAARSSRDGRRWRAWVFRLRDFRFRFEI